MDIPASKRFAEFYSNMFTLPKPNGDVRPFLDLKALNHIYNCSVFLDGISPLGSSIATGWDFLASIDINDAYLHEPIFQPHQMFLWFAIEGHHFQFVALGLPQPHQVFTKVLASVLAC